MELITINFETILPKLKIPLKEAKKVDFVISFNNFDSYLKSYELKSSPYFITTVVGFATSTQDATLNLTHNCFSNFYGQASVVSDQKIVVNANQMLQTTKENRATGRFLESKNTLFDFLTQNLPDTPNQKTFKIAV